MADRTLREKIAALTSYDQCLKRPLAMVEATDGGGNWIDRRHVLALLDAHTAAQPAPDAVAEARPSRCRPENYADGVQCQGCGKMWGDEGPDECPLEPLP